MNKRFVHYSLMLTLVAAVCASLACAPRAMRGGEGTANPNMDQPAMSTQLDKADIDYLVSENLEALYSSRAWIRDVEGAPQPPVLAIWPIQNATSEHLDDQMLMLLSSLEASLINSGDVTVVAKQRQADLAREIGIQQGAIYDQRYAAQLGKQLGARFFLTGKLTSVDERLEKTRRVSYVLFTQVLEIETGIVKFQHETARTKALKR